MFKLVGVHTQGVNQTPTALMGIIKNILTKGTVTKSKSDIFYTSSGVKTSTDIEVSNTRDKKWYSILYIASLNKNQITIEINIERQLGSLTSDPTKIMNLLYLHAFERADLKSSLLDLKENHDLPDPINTEVVELIERLLTSLRDKGFYI